MIKLKQNKNVSLTYLRGLEVAELNEEDIIKLYIKLEFF